MKLTQVHPTNPLVDSTPTPMIEERFDAPEDDADDQLFGHEQVTAKFRRELKLIQRTNPQLYDKIVNFR